MSGKRYPCGRRELFTLEMFFGMDAVMRDDRNQAALKERCRLAGKHTWKLYRAGCGMMEKAFSQLLDTCEVKTLKHFQDIGMHFTPVLKRKIMGQTPYVYIEAEDLSVIVNKAMEAECAFCMKEDKEEHDCPLRWAIAHVIPPDEMSKKAECPYKDCARNCQLGSYIAKD